jgi:transcriptional regulator with XRE-family HTH domain
MKVIEKRVRSVREKFNLSQKELTRRFLISHRAPSEIGRGGKNRRPRYCPSWSHASWWTDAGFLPERAKRRLTPNVVELLKGFRALSEEGRKKLLRILKVLMVVDRGKG